MNPTPFERFLGGVIGTALVLLVLLLAAGVVSAWKSVLTS